MKKIITILLCLLLAVSLVACGNNGPPNANKDFDEAQKNFEDIEASTNKKDIEKTIEKVFGVDISLPDADSYSADTMEISGSSMYVVMISGSKQNAEQYYNSVKSKFSKWTAVDAAKTFSYETEDVTYGAVIEDEDGVLHIVFSMTDRELTDAFRDLVGDTSAFRAELKTRTGLDITFPDIVTSVGLPSSNTVGSKVEYSGMLLAGSANLDATGFQAVIDTLTPQLTGYTKGEPIQGTNTTTVQWINNADSTKYFEIVLNDYDGSTWVNFGFTYSDRSLLDPWPATELESFLGVASVLPEYEGEYRSLEFSYDAEYNPDDFTIELSGADEEELNAWVASLVAAGFAEESVEQSWGDPIKQYTKQVNDGLYLIVLPRIYGYGSGDIRLTKEVYTNLDWPTEALVTAYGQQVANAIPQIEKAAKRSFIFEEGSYSYDTLTVENNASMELYNDYLAKLVAAEFEKTYGNDYSTYVTYTKVFDNWDELKISVEYREDSYGDTNELELEITFKEYVGFGVALPENVEIVIQNTMVIGDRSGTTETRIIKIGESYYMTGVYAFDAYYKFNAETRTWTVYNGTKNSDGTVTWEIEEENVNRANIDNMIKGAFSLKNSNATKADPAQTATYAGVTCTKYEYNVSYGSTLSYAYEYWVDETSNLVFRYYCAYDGGSTETLITNYNTAVTSFGNVELPE